MLRPITPHLNILLKCDICSRGKGKIVNKIIYFILFWAVVLVGCSNQSTETEALEKKISNLEEQLEEVKNHQESNEESESSNDSNEIIESPITINIIDPNSKEVITTFVPSELGFSSDMNAYKAKIEQFAKELARGTEKKDGYDQRMVLDKLDMNGNLIKGNPMIILKENELVDRILDTSKNGGDVELPIYITETNYNFNDLGSLDEATIASYTTYFNESDIGRTSNIKLSANTISNVIVGDGDIFSFNTIVGPRTEETGYQPALEIVNGEFVMGIGGGICQTSSTLFNAVDQIGVRYIEWHHHSIDIGYVPKGKDATVSYGSLDFRFQNTTGVPFIINASTNNNSLTVEIKTSLKYAQLLNE